MQKTKEETTDNIVIENNIKRRVPGWLLKLRSYAKGLNITLLDFTNKEIIQSSKKLSYSGVRGWLSWKHLPPAQVIISRSWDQASW